MNGAYCLVQQPKNAYMNAIFMGVWPLFKPSQTGAFLIKS